VRAGTSGRSHKERTQKSTSLTHNLPMSCTTRQFQSYAENASAQSRACPPWRGPSRPSPRLHCYKWKARLLRACESVPQYSQSLVDQQGVGALQVTNAQTHGFGAEASVDKFRKYISKRRKLSRSVRAGEEFAATRGGGGSESLRSGLTSERRNVSEFPPSAAKIMAI
jgi:hypothetical protein